MLKISMKAPPHEALLFIVAAKKGVSEGKIVQFA
jgi:hypothetical protein